MPAANSYVLGTQVRITVTFASTAGVPVDPTPIRFTTESPTGVLAVITSTSTSVVNPSSGEFYLDVLPASLGTWGYRVESLGTLKLAGEGHFFIRNTVF